MDGDRVYRSCSAPIRQNLGARERWHGPDGGLIWCWERGRLMRAERPEIARRAENGELPVLPWKGGIANPQQDEEGRSEDEGQSAQQREAGRTSGKNNNKKRGTLEYLAMWQGLRNEDLNISLADRTEITCSATGKTVVFDPAYLAG